MAHAKNHDYHILPPSIWPFLSAVSAFVMLSGGVVWMKNVDSPWLFLIGFVAVLYCMFGWWKDVIFESKQGDHTEVVRIGLRYGVIMFIVSEAFFFLAWFWNFFKHALYPTSTTAGFESWPPVGVETFNAWHLPLINTLILLLSGCFATWAHHAIAHENNRKEMAEGLFYAVILGVLFTFLQGVEYAEAQFAFSSVNGGNIYGATFFMATGFHGFHVIIGTLFLFICYLRAKAGHFTKEAHVGFEAAAWYWHFVDVVWLFLFASVYIWGA